ncbi:MAG: hypothetical protein V2I97_04725 [Desulfococcaceae bacterium]|jgi:hypothetical protein|nr:hypothetical protein [Desulfococcaceae bacterium]
MGKMTGFIIVLAAMLFAGTATGIAGSVSYTYDADGRVVYADYGGLNVSYAYDTNGNLLQRVVSGRDPGDVYGDGDINLKDALTALQVSAGMLPFGVSLSGDVDDNGKINVIEAVFVLQSVSGLRGGR